MNVSKFRKSPRWLWYRFLWHIAPYVNLKGPINLHIETNSQCNLKCPICHQAERTYELKQAELNSVFAKMNEGLRLGVKSVKFNWRGEPLIYKNIWPILNFALKHFIVEMNTNLSVNLNDEQIETVSKIHSLRVSMDSVTNYAEARKGGKMHLVFSNIARILEHRDIIEINRTESNITESLPEFVEAFHKELYRAAGKMTECSRIKIRSVPARRRNSSGVFNDDLRKVRKYCGQPSRRLLVSASGNIYPCCVPYHEPKNFIVGSDSLEKAWDSKKRKELVKDLRKMKFNYNVCKNCPSSDAWK